MFGYKSECPKCKSGNIAEGNFPLWCLDCGWHHLNDRPCTVCGKPSFSAVGSDGKSWYGCQDHSAVEQRWPGFHERLHEGLKKQAVLKESDSEIGSMPVPIHFDDEIILSPILCGEKFPFVTVERIIGRLPFADPCGEMVVPDVPILVLNGTLSDEIYKRPWTKIDDPRSVVFADAYNASCHGSVEERWTFARSMADVWERLKTKRSK